MNQAGNHRSISRMHFFSFAAILLIFAIIVSVMLISGDMRHHRRSSDLLRQQIIQSKKEYIRDAIIRTIQDIDNDRRFHEKDHSHHTTPEQITKHLQEMAKARIRNTRLKDNGYIWVDDIHDYKGGDGFATRIVHASLPETEGLVVSTKINDGHGNFFYQDMLDGINSTGECYFSYWFNKFGSEEVGQKISYVHHYKPWDWMIATGFYFDDVDALVATEKLKARQDMYAEIRNTAGVTLLAFCAALAVAYFSQKRIHRVINHYINQLEKNDFALLELNETLEEKVKQRTAALAQAQEAGQAGTWTWDIPADLWITTSFIADLLGVRHTRFKTDDLVTFVREDDKARVGKALEQSLKYGSPYKIEHRIIRRDTGEIRVVRNQGVVSKWDGGKPVEFSGIVQDITDWNRTEQRLQMIHDVLDNSLNGFDIVDSFGRTLYANKARLKMWGYASLDEIIGKPITDDLANPAQAGRIMKQVREEGEFSGEIGARRRNGSTFEIQIYIRLSKNEEGEEVFLTTSLDVSARRKTEIALQQSEAEYRELYNRAPVALFKASLRNNRVLKANPEAVRLFDYEDEEDLINCIDLKELYVNPEDRDEWIEELLEERAAQRSSIQIRRKNGEEFWAQYSGRMTDQNDVAEIMVLDITPRKVAEEALRRSRSEEINAKNLLSNVIDTVPACVFWKNLDSVYLGCNAQFANDTGLASPNQIIGKTDHEMAWIAEADLYQADDQMIMKSGQARLNYEEPQTVNGQEKVLRTSKIPMTDEQGEVFGVLGIYEDITKEKQAQKRLQHLNAVLRSVRDVNQLIVQENDPGKLIRKATEIFIRDRGFIYAWIVLVNEKDEVLDFAQQSSGEFKEAFDRLVEDPNVIPCCLLDAAKVKEKVSRTSSLKNCPDCPFRKHVPEHVSLCLPLEYGGKIYGYISAAADSDAFQNEEESTLFSEVGEDLSYALYSIELERHKETALQEVITAKEIAENANKAKDDFLAVMSHEMRTPLNPIVGFASLMRATYTAEPERSYLDTIIQSANRQLELIEHILNFIQLDKTEPEPNLSTFNLLEVCQTALRDVEHISHDLELIFTNGGEGKVVPDDLHVCGARSMLLQLLDNLLNNACKYTREGSVTLSVGIEERPNDNPIFHFAVLDTGIGVPQDVSDKLFEPFTQVDSSYTRQHEGVGLGLAICRKLTGLLNGDIGVESELNKGSRFWLKIPMEIAKEVRSMVPEKDPSEIKHFSKPCHVLIAEDNKANIMIAERTIEKFGGTTVVAQNGGEAILASEKEKFDVILMDLAMPVLDGFSAAQQIRETENLNRKTPIVALTADFSPQIRSRCEDAGMTHYLTKPIRFNELFEVLDKIV